MAKIGKVSITDIKRVLGYAVKHRHGRLHDIECFDSKYGLTIKRFCDKGYISTDLKQNLEVWNITKQGDEFYKDMFGGFHYYKKRISGIISRIFNTSTVYY